MTDLELHIANLFFYAFHTVLIFFNLFGWIHPRTRKLNLISLLITFASWFVFGFWKGWGYCFLTDWHYKVLRALDEKNMQSSYIAFLIEKLFGWSPNAQLVDLFTVVLATLALAFSVWSNFRKRKRA